MEEWSVGVLEEWIVNVLTLRLFDFLPSCDPLPDYDYDYECLTGLDNPAAPAILKPIEFTARRRARHWNTIIYAQHLKYQYELLNVPGLPTPPNGRISK